MFKGQGSALPLKTRICCADSQEGIPHQSCSLKTYLLAEFNLQSQTSWPSWMPSPSSWHQCSFCRGRGTPGILTALQYRWVQTPGNDSCTQVLVVNFAGAFEVSRTGLLHKAQVTGINGSLFSTYYLSAQQILTTKTFGTIYYLFGTSYFTSRIMFVLFMDLNTFILISLSPYFLQMHLVEEKIPHWGEASLPESAQLLSSPYPPFFCFVCLSVSLLVQICLLE